VTALTTRLLPLASGDRLTRAEFHRRYIASPETTRAELVEGVVYVSSPVSPRHAQPHARIVTWLGAYQARHPEVQLHDNVTVLLDARNEVQPDACLVIEGPGGPRLVLDSHVEGGPQLVAEVAVSSASYDLHDKKEAYLRNGVQEYVVWRVEDGAIDWFRMREGAYTRIEPDAAGVIESATFPGLRLHVGKILAGDLAGVLAELERPSA
jgi:Uma2 family endonuclease